MSLKKKNKQMTFGNWETSENSSFKNIRLERLKEIKQASDWDTIETVFTETYEPGQNKVGQSASAFTYMIGGKGQGLLIRIRVKIQYSNNGIESHI